MSAKISIFLVIASLLASSWLYFGGSPVEGLLNQAENAMAATRFADSYQLSLQALRQAEKNNDNRAQVIALNKAAVSLHLLGNYKEALGLFAKAVSIAGKDAQFDQLAKAQLLNDYAMVLKDSKQYALAEAKSRTAVGIDEQLRDKHDPILSEHLNGLASILMEAGRFNESISVMNRLLVIDEYNEKHALFAKATQSYPDHLVVLGSLFHRMEKYDQAEQTEEAHGDKSTEVLKPLGKLEDLFEICENYSKAEKVCQRTLAIAKASSEKGLICDQVLRYEKLLRLVGRDAEASRLLKAYSVTE